MDKKRKLTDWRYCEGCQGLVDVNLCENDYIDKDGSSMMVYCMWWKPTSCFKLRRQIEILYPFIGCTNLSDEDIESMFHSMC